MKQHIITITTDFGVQSQGIGNIDGVIAQIAPHARIIHLAHGLPDFDIRSAARTMESVVYMPIGIHVCVVDPGVGTKRKTIIVRTKRGDYFVGPDNGVFPSAVDILGGAKKIVTITNKKYMILPISPIFHGRHIFAPAAAHIANGVDIDEFGPQISFEELIPPPYKEAIIRGDTLYAEVIWINKFGSLNINILRATWEKFKVPLYGTVQVSINNKVVSMQYVETFGQVEVGKPLIMKDDYGRVEIAINMGTFAEKFKVRTSDKLLIRKG